MAEPKTKIVETTTEVANVNQSAIETPKVEQSASFQISFIEAAHEAAQISLKKEARRTTVNLSFKNWDVSKIKEFDRCVLLMVADTEVFDEKAQVYNTLPTVFFMDTNNNVYYKAAYQFVNALKRLVPGTNFYAKFDGHEKNSGGNMAETFIVNQYVITE